jgi:hypothetical protein
LLPTNSRLHRYAHAFDRLQAGPVDLSDKAFTNLAHHAVAEAGALLDADEVLRPVVDGGRLRDMLRACAGGDVAPGGARELERLPGSLAIAKETPFAGAFTALGVEGALAHFMELPIEEIFSGPEAERDPPQHLQQDPARSKQFELIAAGHFANTGFKPTFAEPDIVLESDRWGLVGLAAKRVLSLKGLEKR